MIMLNLPNEVVLSVAACSVLRGRGGGGAVEKGGIIHQSAESAGNVRCQVAIGV